MAVHSRCQFTFERDHSLSSRAQRLSSDREDSSELSLQPSWWQPENICQPSGTRGFRLRRGEMFGIVHLGNALPAEITRQLVA